jgi:hypothetical protein
MGVVCPVENRIHSVTVKQTATSEQTCIWAEARVTLAGKARTIRSSGQTAANVADIETAQLAELRKRLYVAGFSKRAIAMAVKGLTHE